MKTAAFQSFFLSFLLEVSGAGHVLETETLKQSVCLHKIGLQDMAGVTSNAFQLSTCTQIALGRC